MPAKPKRILFLIPYPLKEAPSQRFRFEQYLPLLLEHGFQFEIQSFLNVENWKLFYGPGKFLKKVSVLTIGFLKRFAVLFKVSAFDFIFIHREATPVGPPVYEWLLSSLFQKKIIYDFDDAIWLTDKIEESAALRFLKWRSKVAAICSWSYKISCGNDFLCAFALSYAKSVVYNPTTIDTEGSHKSDLQKKVAKSPDQIVIGWTGSHSTLKYLKIIEPSLQKIEREFSNIVFAIIADKQPDIKLKNCNFIKWSAETEIMDLMTFDIGIMPLPNDEWSKGKCGFKALQYMALRIPAVASDVGVNSKLIDHGINGFLCKSSEDWDRELKSLIEDPERRKLIGEKGQEKVINHYSVASNSSNFLSLFE